VALGAVLLHGLLAQRGAAADLLAAVDLRYAFAIVGVLSLASMIFFYRLARDAGSEVSGHRG
jgi:hypothetical protein